MRQGLVMSERCWSGRCRIRRRYHNAFRAWKDYSVRWIPLRSCRPGLARMMARLRRDRRALGRAAGDGRRPRRRLRAPGLLGDRVLLAGHRRPDRSPRAREADRRGHRDDAGSGAQGAPRPRAGDPRVRVARARAARQSQLHELRGPRAAVRAVERVRRAGAFARRRGSGAFRSPDASRTAAISPRPTRAPKPRGSRPPATTSTCPAFPRTRRSATSTTRCCRRSSATARSSSRGSSSTSSRIRSST